MQVYFVIIEGNNTGLVVNAKSPIEALQLFSTSLPNDGEAVIQSDEDDEFFISRRGDNNHRVTVMEATFLN